MPRAWRRAVTVGVAALLTATLAACGARVDTVLEVADDGSGTRQMTLTLANSDRDSYVTGGNDAIEASITRHLPPELSFSGLTQNESDVVGVFTLTFSSVDDYRKKVAGLLAAGGATYVPEIDIRVEDTLFSRGFVVEENIRSSELLAWLEPGLIADGVVGAASGGSMTTSGTTTLKIRGTDNDVYEPISRSEVIDLGMRSITMETTVTDATSVTRAITYTMPTAAYKTHPEEVDAFLQDATPPDGTLTEPTVVSDTTTWTLTFQAAADQIADATTTALNGADTTFELAETFDPTTGGIRMHLTGSTDCTTICSPDAPDIEDTLIVAAPWQAGSDDLLYRAEERSTGWAYTFDDPYDTWFERPVELSTVDIVTVIDLDGQVTQEATLRVRPELDRTVGAGLEQLFGNQPLLELSVERPDGEDAAYTLKAGPADGDAITNAFAAVGITGMWATVTPTSSDSFFKHDLAVTVGGPFADDEAQAIWGAPTVTHTVRAEGVTLTDGSDSGTEILVSGPYTELHATGWKTAGIITLIALLLVGAALVVVAVTQRRRIAVLLKKGSATAAAGGQKALAQAGAVRAAAEATMREAEQGREAERGRGADTQGVVLPTPGLVTSPAPAGWTEADLR